MAKGRAASRDPKAPHGYDENGLPRAPFGYKVDGTPRVSNRGAQPGQRGNANSTGGKSAGGGTRLARENATDRTRRENFVALAETFICDPMAAVSCVRPVVKRIGQRNADALAHTSLILASFADPVAKSLITLSASKPGTLRWLDSIEDKGPQLIAMSVGLQLAKSLAGAWLNPNAELAEAGRLRARMRAEEMARLVQEQAEEMGLAAELPDGYVPEPDADGAGQPEAEHAYASQAA